MKQRGTIKGNIIIFLAIFKISTITKSLISRLILYLYYCKHHALGISRKLILVKHTIYRYIKVNILENDTIIKNSNVINLC